MELNRRADRLSWRFPPTLDGCVCGYQQREYHSVAQQSAFFASQLPTLETADQSTDQSDWPAHDTTVFSAFSEAVVAAVQTAEQTTQSTAFLSTDGTNFTAVDPTHRDSLGAAQQPPQQLHRQPDHLETVSRPQCVSLCEVILPHESTQRSAVETTDRTTVSPAQQTTVEPTNLASQQTAFQSAFETAFQSTFSQTFVSALIAAFCLHCCEQQRCDYPVCHRVDD